MAHLRIMAATAADTDAIRVETFRGKSYTVVPVIALVEGVLQGLSADEPEFAPAKEFGKFPMTWNGRPITLDHPRRDGVLCSANDPDIREEYEFGFLANTVLDDKKLKTEAWIDDELVAEKGGEFETLRQSLIDGEMIEVSTGLFCDVYEKKSKYNGAKYAGAWANVVPDHLAFLPNAIGACSVEDGCGAPRLNTATLKTVNSTHAHGACCDDCAKTGGSCMTTNTTTTEGGGNALEETATTGATAQAEPTGATSVPAGDGEPTAEPVATEEAPTAGTEAAEGDGAPGPAEVAEEIQANADQAAAYRRLTANAVAPSITFENARTIVQRALSEKWPSGSQSSCGCCYYGGNWIAAMTTEMVAFERRDSNYNYFTVGVGYSIDANGAVTFTGEPVPVNLIVSIVPVPDESATESGLVDNAAASGAEPQQEEVHVADENTQNGGAGGDVNANGAGAPAIRTQEQYLADMPPEMADVMREGLQLRANKKTNLVKGILANSQVFTEEELNSKDIPELEKLHSMSAPKQSFEGRAFPSAVTPGTEGISAQGAGMRDNQLTVPEAPKAFARKSDNDTAQAA